jgi:hypothetical protein
MAAHRHEFLAPEPGDRLVVRLCSSDPLTGLAAAFHEMRGANLCIDTAMSPEWKRRDAVELCVMRCGGIDRFQSTILQVWPAPAGSRLLLARPRFSEHLQRRLEFRVPLMVATRLTVHSLSRGSSRHAADIIDLSANGALVRSAVVLEPGQIVEIEAPMGKEGVSESVAAKVVSSSAAQGADARIDGRFDTRLQFDDGEKLTLPQAIRDEIAIFVFEQQRSSLKLRRLLRGGGPQNTQRKRTRSLGDILARLRVHPSDGYTGKEDMR